MDWNKKIYPSDILRFIYEPFKLFMSRLRTICKEIFDIKWKGSHEKIWSVAQTQEDLEYIDRFKRGSFAMFGRTLYPSELPSQRKPIKPPPPPKPPSKRYDGIDLSTHAKEILESLDRTEKTMNDGMCELDRKLKEVWKMIDDM